MKKLVSILVGIVMSAELWIMLDVAFAMLCSTYIPLRIFVLICLLTLLFTMWFSLKHSKAALVLLLCVTAFLVATAVGFRRYRVQSRNEEFVQQFAYRDTDSDKNELFADKRVMLLVPHEDDDLNVLGGVTDEYIRYGSEVFVVFMANGDFYGRSVGEFRISEALQLYDYLGVPENHVIFLGYGDELRTSDYHLYNADGNEIIMSKAGETTTYCIETHPPFKNGRAYTKNNLLQDMEDVILQIRPDIIYCIDYDEHMDHKACSLMFENVMGKILHSVPDYSPEIYKGFAYNTAWSAEHDYLTRNIKATQNIFNGDSAQSPAVYRWDERVRLPVKAALLSRLFWSSELRDELGYYDSQEASRHGLGIINGDKVFWKRATESLCRNAVITVSSGDGARLNDFMLLDSNDLLDLTYEPCDGTWVPEQSDEKKEITIELNSEKTVYEIVLYDNPAEDSNVLNAVIRFDDGTEIETGALDTSGAASRYKVEGKQITSLQISLTATEGQRAGLTEIEVFGETAIDQKPSFIKMLDREDNFVYDYIIKLTGNDRFTLYSDGIIPELSEENYDVQCDNAECDAAIQDGMIRVMCPRNKSCTVMVKQTDSGLSDSVYIQNPDLYKRIILSIYQEMEQIEVEDYELLHFPGILNWNPF